MPELDDYHKFCDRICTHLMSYELGIPFQWDTPLPTTGNGRRGSGVQEDIRLTVINRQIHYYQRISEGEEYEIQPSGSLWWLPHIPEHLCSPATEEQLKMTEDLLTFPLPPVLRALYEQVAHGGFGPGYDGILGIIDSEGLETWLLTDQYLLHKASKEPILLSECERRSFESGKDYLKYRTDWEMVVPQGYWPDRLLPLCHDGCGLYYFLDTPTGRVFYSGGDSLALRLVADSVEDLFDRWMNDDLFDYARFSYDHPDPFDFTD